MLTEYWTSPTNISSKSSTMKSSSSSVSTCPTQPPSTVTNSGYRLAGHAHIFCYNHYLHHFSFIYSYRLGNTHLLCHNHGFHDSAYIHPHGSRRINHNRHSPLHGNRAHNFSTKHRYRCFSLPRNHLHRGDYNGKLVNNYCRRRYNFF